MVVILTHLKIRTDRRRKAFLILPGGKEIAFDGIIEIDCGFCATRHPIDIIRNSPCLQREPIRQEAR